MSHVKHFYAAAAVATALVSLSAIAAPVAETLPNGRSVYGESVQSAPGARMIDLSKAQSLNVRCGDIVTFVNGGKSFSWKFDVVTHRAVPIAKIAPADFGPATQVVYVARNDNERGGT